MEHKLPNVIIAGVNKAGTSSLFTYLVQHPEVCGSSKKETCYFLPLRYGEEIKPLDEYENFFKHCNKEKIRIEATPGYFYGGKVLAKKIKETLKNPKIIFILREPVDRCFSFYKHTQAKLWIPKDITFDQYIKNAMKNITKQHLEEKDYFERGVKESIYIEFLREWYDVFKKDDIKILFFDDLKNNPYSLIVSLTKWLDIDDKFYNNFSFEIENKSMNYKNKYVHIIALNLYRILEPFLRKNYNLKKYIRKVYYLVNLSKHNSDLDPNTRKLLEEFYMPYNKELSIFLKKQGYSNLPNWLNIK